MERDLTSQRVPDVSPDERARSELMKQIRKLRWMGMEQDAARLQASLSERSPPYYNGGRIGVSGDEPDLMVHF